MKDWTGRQLTECMCLTHERLTCRSVPPQPQINDSTEQHRSEHKEGTLAEMRRGKKTMTMKIMTVTSVMIASVEI